MAKKTKKTKITETLVNQLQENPSPVIKEEEEKPTKERKKTSKKHTKPSPQKSKFFDKPIHQTPDSEIEGINLGISGVL